MKNLLSFLQTYFENILQNLFEDFQPKSKNFGKKGCFHMFLQIQKKQTNKQTNKQKKQTNKQTRTSLVPTDHAARSAYAARSRAQVLRPVIQTGSDGCRHDIRPPWTLTTSHTRLAQMVADTIFDRRELGLKQTNNNHLPKSKLWVSHARKQCFFPSPPFFFCLNDFFFKFKMWFNHMTCISIVLSVQNAKQVVTGKNMKLQTGTWH